MRDYVSLNEIEAALEEDLEIKTEVMKDEENEGSCFVCLMTECIHHELNNKCGYSIIPHVTDKLLVDSFDACESYIIDDYLNEDDYLYWDEEC